MQISDYHDEQIQKTEGSDVSGIRLTWARGPKHTPSFRAGWPRAVWFYLCRKVGYFMYLKV